MSIIFTKGNSIAIIENLIEIWYFKTCPNYSPGFSKSKISIRYSKRFSIIFIEMLHNRVAGVG